MLVEGLIPWLQEHIQSSKLSTQHMVEGVFPLIGSLGASST